MEEVFVTVDFTEEVIEDINKSLKYLQDSCLHVCKLYTYSSIKDQKLRSNIYSKIPKWLDVAYHVHNTFKSSLPSSTTTTTATIGNGSSTTTIGNGMKTWSMTLVDLITDFTDLRRTIMNDYMLRISNRIYQAMGEEVNVSTIMTLFNEYDNSSSSNGDNYMDDFETMILKKLMKERHESMKLISDGMEKLDKVLFETYVMVQKQVILINGGGADEKVCDERSETLVYKEIEARDKRFKAESEQRNRNKCKNLVAIYICFVIAVLIVHHFGLTKVIYNHIQR